jgi:RNA polymerase sigma factor (sigma-70 family)
VSERSDYQLLRDYAGSRSEEAFAELVRRYLDFVYSAVLRMVGDNHLAEDVTQGVFLALAQNTRQLADRQVLAGWLHRTARNLAANAVRSDVRRRAREQKAAAMNELLSTEPGIAWEHIAPHLDDALGKLDETDRDALFLRYFQRKSLREVGATLGMSDDAAQKRVSRAVERLREFFAKRGVSVGASGLAVVISANAVQAAPAGLAISISTAATLTGTAASASAVSTATKALAMTSLQKALLSTAVLAALATPIVIQQRAKNNLIKENQDLRQQMALQAKQSDERLGQSRVDQAELDRLRDEHSELLRLRGEIGRQRAQLEQLAAASTRPAGSAALAATTSKSTDRDVPRQSWSDAGFATPEAALQTRGWAVINGNRERFSESVLITPGARKLVEDMLVQMASSSTDPDKDRLIREAVNKKWGVEEAVLMPLMALDHDKTFTGMRPCSCP